MLYLLHDKLYESQMGDYQKYTIISLDSFYYQTYFFSYHPWDPVDKKLRFQSRPICRSFYHHFYPQGLLCALRQFWCLMETWISGLLQD